MLAREGTKSVSSEMQCVLPSCTPSSRLYSMRFRAPRRSTEQVFEAVGRQVWDSNRSIERQSAALKRLGIRRRQDSDLLEFAKHRAVAETINLKKVAERMGDLQERRQVPVSSLIRSATFFRLIVSAT